MREPKNPQTLTFSVENCTFHSSPLKSNDLRVAPQSTPNRLEASFNVHSDLKAAAAAAKRPLCCNPRKPGPAVGPNSSHAPTRELARVVSHRFDARPTLPCTKALLPPAAVTLLEPLGLALADLQQLGCFGQLQFASLHSAQHFHAPQFLCTHPCPSQSRLLLRGLRLGDISIGRSWGHHHWAATRPVCLLCLRPVMPPSG